MTLELLRVVSGVSRDIGYKKSYTRTSPCWLGVRGNATATSLF